MLILTMLANCQLAIAQCFVTIPANAVVVNNDTTVGMVNQYWWVCSGDTLNGSGVYNTYYVESGGSLDMSGIEKIVYLKSGASIDCSGIDDTIYYESGAIINCSGNHVDIPCSQIIFDYSNAPSPGCDVTSTSDINMLGKELKVSPNPASDQLRISFTSSKAGVGKLITRNTLGQTVLSSSYNLKIGKNRIVIDATGLPNGIYFLRLSAEGLTSSTKINVTH